jgi:hypothetical protein
VSFRPSSFTRNFDDLSIEQRLVGNDMSPNQAKREFYGFYDILRENESIFS